VANYSVLDEADERFDYQGNPTRDERTFHAQLSATFAAAGLPNVAWLVDTGRNGAGGIRRQWGAWCNTRGAGLGERPRADPAPGIDAYFWVKPPGESDGTSDATAPDYDPDCGAEDAATPAPGAGEWFHSYVLDLVRNANPPLAPTPSGPAR
jgi:cellulose 1,4-beta-cellobiosidase